jgi:hypothetical protein
MATIRSLDSRVSGYAQKFIAALAAAGIKVELTSARRDAAVQAKLYADWKAGRSHFPAAPPGRSTHATGQAFDLKLDGIRPKLDPPYPWQYQAAGELWESVGLTWGGRFRDPIHFDFRPRG